MKKAKRFLTGLLSAALALSLCAMPAMAADAPALPETTKTTDSVIDPNQKGSITIYKYLHDKDIVSENGTGEKQNIPAGTEPAEDVGFTIYRVKGAAKLQEYYDGKTSEETAQVSNYIDENGKVKAQYNNLIEGVADIGVEKKTNADGMVQFTDLPVGLYLVMETSKPATVTEPVAPFLVSIPMTRVTNDANAQKQWLYDVVVYPKNSTHKGAITLKKVGVEGETVTPLAGVIFNLERQKDDGTGAWVRYPDETTTFETTGADGKVTIDGLKPGNYRFQEIGYSDTVTGENRKYVINANDYYEFTIAADGTVSRKEDAEHSSDYTAENTTVTVKNYAPDIEKTVKDRTSDEYRKAADYNVGDEIPYKITVTVPQNITRLKKFEVTDTPTNLVDQVVDANGKSLISVQYNSDEGLVAVPTDAYTITKLDNGGFKVAFNPAKMEACAGKQIVISYKAKLTADADMTTDGNSNKAKLEYSNKTDVSDAEKDNPENNYKRSDETVVYTFQIQIVKKADVKENNKDIFLDGVTFDLYKLVGNDEKLPDGAVEIDSATANALKLPTAGEGKKWAKVKSNITTANGGKANVDGLANGTYYLVETKTNKGYNLLQAPVKVELNIAYKTTWTESLEYKGDVLVKYDVTEKEETFTNNGTQTGVTVDGTTYGRHVTEIINRKGFNLPTTGGFGTLLFSGIGVLLVVAGVGVLLSLKKKNRA